jgi:hypothetical protein
MRLAEGATCQDIKKITVTREPYLKSMAVSMAKTLIVIYYNGFYDGMRRQRGFLSHCRGAFNFIRPAMPKWCSLIQTSQFEVSMAGLRGECIWS